MSAMLLYTILKTIFFNDLHSNQSCYVSFKVNPMNTYYKGTAP